MGTGNGGSPTSALPEDKLKASSFLLASNESRLTEQARPGFDTRLGCVRGLATIITAGARQPPGELVGVSDRPLPGPEVRPDFRPVPLDPAPGPLVEPADPALTPSCRATNSDRIVMQFAAATREPAGPAVRLQQQRKAKPGVMVPRGRQAALITDRRLVCLTRSPGSRGERSTRAYLRGHRHHPAAHTGKLSSDGPW